MISYELVEDKEAVRKIPDKIGNPPNIYSPSAPETAIEIATGTPTISKATRRIKTNAIVIGASPPRFGSNDRPKECPLMLYIYPQSHSAKSKKPDAVRQPIARSGP